MSIEGLTSRRAVVAGLAAAPVAGLPVIAGVAAEADPIFAAIERHKAAEARFSTACGLTDDVAARTERRIITSEDRAEFDAAERAADEAWDGFIVTSPTTIAGVRAFIRHCVNQDSAGVLAEPLEVLLASPVLADCEGRS